MHILINITAILAIFLMYYYNIYEFIYCCFSLLRRVKGIVKMFEKQFAKYARAVSDERERRSTDYTAPSLQRRLLPLRLALLLCLKRCFLTMRSKRRN